MQEDVIFLCDNCDEEVATAVSQTSDGIVEFWEDCPICSHTNLIHVEMDEDTDTDVWCEPLRKDRAAPNSDPAGN